MTSRDRVLSAIDHKQPDRVPVDFGGHRSSGAMAIAYARLKETLGITSGNVYVHDIIQQLAIIEEPVLDALGIDVVEMGRGFMTDDADWQDWVLPDGTPCKIPGYVNVEKRGPHSTIVSDNGIDLAIQKEGCLYFEQCHYPLIDRPIQSDDLHDLADRYQETVWTGIPSPPGPVTLDEDGLEFLSKKAKAFRESTDRAIVGLFGGSMFELPMWLYRIDNSLANMALYPDDVDRLLRALNDLHVANLEKWLGAVGPHIDIVLFGDDLGGQNGPLISPDMYRRHAKPYHQRMFRTAKEIADVKVMLHCCGGIEPLLDDLIDAGLDAINPVQITCTGMDTHHLKDTYGDRLCFWGGGCDTRDVLPNGAPDQVREHVRKQVDILSPGGGFVFQQVHNVMADVPPENVIAMFEAIRG